MFEPTQIKGLLELIEAYGGFLFSGAHIGGDPFPKGPRTQIIDILGPSTINIIVLGP